MNLLPTSRPGAEKKACSGNLGLKGSCVHGTVRRVGNVKRQPKKLRQLSPPRRNKEKKFKRGGEVGTLPRKGIHGAKNSTPAEEGMISLVFNVNEEKQKNKNQWCGKGRKTIPKEKEEDRRQPQRKGCPQQRKINRPVQSEETGESCPWDRLRKEGRRGVGQSAGRGRILGTKREGKYKHTTYHWIRAHILPAGVDPMREKNPAGKEKKVR